MDILFEFLMKFLTQFQSPALAFLIGGMLLSAFGSKLQIPTAIYQFCVFMLLLRIGINGGMEIRDANIVDMLVPIIMTILIGLIIVFGGSAILTRLPGVKKEDGVATAGLFGAVSASTLAAAMSVLEYDNVTYEAWAPALYPFMDIPALVLAIVLANLYFAKTDKDQKSETQISKIIKDSLRGSALSALLLGMALGLFANTSSVFDSFYNPLFKGLLSILMLTMGMEAYSRLKEMRQVAHWFVIYAALAPIIHGLIAFCFGYIAHITVGFSPGGVIMLSILAASSSDVSGPPTLRAAIPSANPSSYIGSSTSVGTPIAIAVCIPLFITLADWVFDIGL
ncbi:MAG: sodium-dependent bicarbonate transport family permease [Pseudomonadota bacterium]